MKLSKLAKKRKVVETRHSTEMDVFYQILDRLNDPATLNFFLKYLPSNPQVSACKLVWDGLFLTLQDVRKERVLFIYAPNGKQEPVFCIWNKQKKHTRYPKFLFWEYWRHNILQDNRPELDLPRDVIICIYNHLSVRDILQCRLVATKWERVSRLPIVWDKYAGSFEETLKYACLVRDPGQFVLDNPHALKTIQAAWLHKYNILNSNTCVIEHPGKRRKVLEVRGMHHTYPNKYATLAVKCREDTPGSIAWVSQNKQLYIACFTNKHGCTNNKEFFRNMMLDFIN